MGEFPGFSVQTYIENLMHTQEILEQEGRVQGRIHRFLLTVRK